MRKKRGLALLLAGVLALTVLGVPVAAEEEKTSINVGITDDVATLGPYDPANMGGFHVYPMIYQGLFCRTEFAGTDMSPQIGKEYTTSDDGMTITVTMFDYVKDSAGNDITADDVVFSYEYMRESGLYASMFDYLDTITKIDDYTVELGFKDMKMGIVEEALESYIVDESFDESTYITSPIGTGPYLVTEFSPSASITFEKNEDWWQTDPEYIHPDNVVGADVINCKIITESAQVAIALETGDIDLATSVSYQNVENFFMDDEGNALDDYNIYTWHSQLIRNIAFNTSEDSIFYDNVPLRQAVCYAINNEELVEALLQGAGTTLHSYGCDVYADYDSDWDNEDYYDYDPEMAKEKLAEAGYEPGEVTLRIISQTDDTFKKASEMIQSYLANVGINLEITQYDSALYSTYRTDFTQWDLLLDNQANSSGMTSIWGGFLVNTYTTRNGEGVDFTGSNNEELTAMVKLANSPEGHTKENIDAVHDYVKDNAIVYGLWAETLYTVSDKKVDTAYLSSKLYVVPGPCEVVE